MNNQFKFLSLSLTLFIADQFSKWIVIQRIIIPHLDQRSNIGFIEWLGTISEPVSYAQIPITSFFNIVMVWNQGVSFGLLTQNTNIGVLLLIGLSLLISSFFIAWLPRVHSSVQSIAIACIIGGALANVLDRVRFGAVIDFLDFHAYGYHYPAFNLADSCIVIGVFVLIIHSLFFEKSMH